MLKGKKEEETSEWKKKTFIIYNPTHKIHENEIYAKK